MLLEFSQATEYVYGQSEVLIAGASKYVNRIMLFPQASLNEFCVASWLRATLLARLLYQR